MFDAQSIKAQDIEGLSPSELGVMIPQLLSYIEEQSKHIYEQRRQLDSAQQAIKWRDAKIEKITFELARRSCARTWHRTSRPSAEPART